MPLQMLHVAGQVGEQRPHLPTPLGLQEEALVVAGGWRERSPVRRGWRGPHRALCPSVDLSARVSRPPHPHPGHLPPSLSSI